jgi:hypothetical protein
MDERIAEMQETIKSYEVSKSFALTNEGRAFWQGGINALKKKITMLRKGEKQNARDSNVTVQRP